MIDFIQVEPTGKIVMHGQCGEDDLELQQIPGCRVVATTGQYGQHYYDWQAQKVVALPPRPSEHHEFDYTRKAWVLDREAAYMALREERDSRLARSDWVMLEDVALSDEARQAWRAYRQALRDITQTADPLHPVWPTEPA